MNEIVNKFLLARDKFMPEMHLKQSKFTYIACGPFNKKFKETGNSRYIHKDELDKAWFQHDMAYGDFKNLAKRTASEKVLRDKTFNIAKILNMMDIKNVLPLWFINFLRKRLLLVEKINLCKISNLQMNFINQLLESLKREKYIYHLKTIFRVLI